MSHMGEGRKKGKSAKYFTWTVEMDRILSATLLDQLNLGNRLEGKLAWKPAAWTACVNALREQLGVDITKQNVQSRLRTWVSDMLSKSGFSWDYTRGMIHVSEESVWNAWVKEHPEAAPYHRKISMENWDDICTLIAQDRATGEGAQIALEADMQMTNEGSINLEESFGNDGLNDDATNVNGGQLGRSLSSSGSQSKKRKQRSLEALYQILGRMADSLDKVFSELLKLSTKLVLEEVSKVPNLNETQVLEAVDILRRDAMKFQTFCDLPDDLKMQWIIIQLC